MNKTLKELAVDSFYLYCIQGLNYLFPLLVLPYLISTLGPDRFGIFAYSQSFIQFLILIVDFGFNVSITKRITSLPAHSKKIVEIFWLTIIIKSALFIMCFISVCLWLNFSSSFSQYKVGIMWSMLSLVGTIFFPIWLFQGLNKVKIVSIINAISKLLTFPLIFVFVQKPADYIIAVILQSSSLLIAGLISMIFVFRIKFYRNIPFDKVNWIKIRKIFKDGWPIFLSNSSISLYTSSLTVMLGFYASTQQVGLFGAIERVVRVVCFGIYVPINQASFPKIARLRISNFIEAKRIFRILFYSILILMIFIIAAFLVMEPYFLKLFFKGYGGISTLLKISIFTILPIALGGVCGQLGLLGLGGEQQKKTFSKIYAFVGVSSIFISFIAIKFFNVEGAVLSMMLTETCIFIIMLYFVKRFKYL